MAAQVGAGLTAAGHTFEIADLAAEGFEPRYTTADHRVHRAHATPPVDVLAEQARIERADALVIAFPIYWWSDDSAFDRYGYAKAMHTQIDYGIFDYCGAQVLTSKLLLDSESGGAQAHLQTARAVGQGIFERETVAG
ncbi:NAD(P)H-dependent oxidoreductase [Pseudomonas paralactis]|uniref:NAD(P)H-dependent oxidoreductase n=1 Tax=Pseudomonas paralactis TaxID=1615673 RepID=A0ABS0V4D3_9PSED|nr:NAD(P)H-dependent oxidoreductase [Pseudomonas paralactis]